MGYNSKQLLKKFKKKLKELFIIITHQKNNTFIKYNNHLLKNNSKSFDFLYKVLCNCLTPGIENLLNLNYSYYFLPNLLFL